MIATLFGKYAFLAVPVLFVCAFCIEWAGTRPQRKKGDK